MGVGPDRGDLLGLNHFKASCDCNDLPCHVPLVTNDSRHALPAISRKTLNC